MKNSLQLLALGLVLFLGACSNGEPNGDKDTVTPPIVTPPPAEVDFLKKIQGKTVYNNATTQNLTTLVGTFNSDGKVFVLTSPVSIYTFVKATDENTAIYETTKNETKTTLTFTTTDGKSGSINLDGKITQVWLESGTPPVTPPTTESKFLDKVANKTAYEDATYKTKYGTFNADGKTFTFADNSEVLTFVKATDENNGEYALDPVTLTITTSDGITGSAPEASGSTKLWFK